LQLIENVFLLCKGKGKMKRERRRQKGEGTGKTNGKRKLPYRHFLFPLRAVSETN